MSDRRDSLAFDIDSWPTPHILPQPVAFELEPVDTSLAEALARNIADTRDRLLLIAR